MSDEEDVQRPGDVAQRLLALVLEGDVQLAADLEADAGRTRDAAGRRMGQHARGQIDVVSVEIVTLHQHVAEVDADAEADGAVGGKLRIGGSQPVLDFECRLRRLQRAGEFGEKALAHGLEDAAIVARHGGIEDGEPVLAERRERRFLVGLHQPAEAHDLGRHDGCEPPLHARPRHVTSPEKFLSDYVF